MRYYFAGRYRRHAELAGYRDELTAALPGVEVTSRWIDRHDGALEASYTAEALAADPASAWRHGQADLEDLDAADVIVEFTGDNDGYVTGGRHVEFGWALRQWAMDDYLNQGADGAPFGVIRLVIVGPRENVFHCHPATEVYATWADFLRHEVGARGAELVRRYHPSIADD